jgi:hypothetical protein
VLAGVGVNAVLVGLVAGIDVDGKVGVMISTGAVPTPIPNSPSLSLDTFCHLVVMSVRSGLAGQQP